MTGSGWLPTKFSIPGGRSFCTKYRSREDFLFSVVSAVPRRSKTDSFSRRLECVPWSKDRQGRKCYIITEWFFLLIIFVNYILSFGLVGLWTIRLSAGAGAHIEDSSRSCVEDMTITNVIIKTPDKKLDWGVNDVMTRRDGEGISGFRKRR